MDKCFLCGKRLGKHPKLVDTRDDQLVYVGRECFKLVMAAGERGLPATPWGDNGVKLYPLK